MILKLIILGVALIAIYKFMGGSISLPRKKKSSDNVDSDALEECEACGTYVTKKESIQEKGKIYCSKECLTS